MLMHLGLVTTHFFTVFFSTPLQVVHTGMGCASFLEGEGVDRTDAECDTWTSSRQKRM